MHRVRPDDPLEAVATTGCIQPTEPIRKPVPASEDNAIMNDKTLLRTGVIGTVVAAICCFTPVLVILFGAVGFSALVGYLDYVLLPALAAFIALTLYALWRRRHRPVHPAAPPAAHPNGDRDV